MTKPPTPRMRMPRVEPLWTIASAAEMLGISASQVWRMLWSHRPDFPIARYDRAQSGHPRRRRVLTNAEVEKLQRLRDAGLRVKRLIP